MPASTGPLGALGGVLSGLFGPILRRLQAIQKVLVRLFALFVVLWIGFSTIPTRLSDFRDVSGGTWFGDSVSARGLRWLEGYLIPHGTTVLILGPFDAFTVLMEIGAALAAFITILVALFLLLRWLWPGMRSQERWSTGEILVTAPILFGGGVGLALYILPTLFSWGIGLQPAAGGTATVSLTQFISTTVIFTLGVGVAFEVPILCAGLAQAGVLKAKTMRKKENAAIAGFGCVALAFLISPGIGGGVIEFPLAGVFGLLYLLGYLMVRRVERARDRKEPSKVGASTTG